MIAMQIEPLFSRRRKRHFVESRFKDLANRKLTEWEVVLAAAKKQDLPLDEYVHRALLFAAKRDLSLAKARDRLKKGERASGVPGAADQRIQAAYDRLVAAKQPITPSALKRLAPANLDVVKGWIERNAEELEVPVQTMPAMRYGPRSQV